MLRAITSEMMYALIACVLGAAAFAALKSKLPTLFKGVAIVAALGVTAMMLAIDAKFWGVVVMGGAVIILFFLPWLDNCAVKSIGERVSQVGTLFYFGFFLLMPWWSKMGATKTVPDRINFTAH